jgi:hypothetical protein
MNGWHDIDSIRQSVAGYDDPQPLPDAAQRAREASRLAMRRLYDKRRRMGLNAHGKPFKVRQRANWRFTIDKR